MSDPSLVRNESVSIVVPLYNEEGNVERLIEAVQAALMDLALPWELILVDDGSTDATVQRARSAAARIGSHVRVVLFRRNFGQTASMQAGIDHARGTLIVTMDGDLQNDPKDIPHMIQHLQANQLDMLAGWRRQRKDDMIRRLPSRIANWLIGRVTGVRLNDYGCSLKAYRAEVIREVKLFGEMHRFIPAWAAAVTVPSRIGEIEVEHHPRTEGKSKYSIFRTFHVLLDLLSVMFFMRYKARPGHFFGAIGLLVGTIGALILGYLAYDKFALGHDIGTRPLLLVGIMLMIASLQFLTTGVMSEMLARIYFGSPDHKSYIVLESEVTGATVEDASWHRPPSTPHTDAQSQQPDKVIGDEERHGMASKQAMRQEAGPFIR
jgi:glycosyltransferase involved in cell wall biosynthesis